MTKYLTLLLFGISMLAACAKELPPRSVDEFVDNPILLEAAMVRCAQDRSKSRYEAECINARQAVARIQAKEEAARTAELEASSERKRRALRRTQAAAAEARRRAAEEIRAREEAEYLSQFGAMPPGEGDAEELPLEGNLPGAEIPEATAEPQDSNDIGGDIEAPSDGGNAPFVEAQPEPPPSDIESIRDELRRRNDESGD